MEMVKCGRKSLAQFLRSIMALRDHFHPPLSVQRPWQGVYSTWASALVSQLNHGVLPRLYFAMPNVKLGGSVEIDEATLEQEEAAVSAPEGLSDVDFASIDLFEVQVFHEEETPRLVAVIELVSPANKDRASHRRTFAAKCAGFLRKGVSVIVVDVVTNCWGDMYGDVLENWGNAPQESGFQDSGLFVASYLPVKHNQAYGFAAWLEPAAVGANLPTVPLGLGIESILQVDLTRLPLQLDLERSYAAACEWLLIEP
jgi:hypothetical protein